MPKRPQFHAVFLVFALQFFCVAENTSQDAVTQAAALFHAGKVKQAETLLRSASAADPNSGALHGALGELLFKEHNYEDSVQELGLATQRDPDSAEYNLLLSEALIGWKHYGVAVEFLNAVRSKFDKQPQFHYDLGIAYYDANKLKEAKDEFQEALRLAPSFEKDQFMLAACLASTGDPAGAISILRQLVKKDPNNAVYWATLGQVLALTGGRNAEALQAVRHALALDPHNPRAQYVAATVFVQTENFSDARPLLEHLEKMNPKALSVHVQLARVYSRLGQRDLARKETLLANELQKQNSSESQPPAPELQSGGADQH